MTVFAEAPFSGAAVGFPGGVGSVTPTRLTAWDCVNCCVTFHTTHWAVLFGFSATKNEPPGSGWASVGCSRVDGHVPSGLRRPSALQTKRYPSLGKLMKGYCSLVSSLKLG